MRTFSRPILILITFIYIYLSTISNGENDYCWKQSERSTLKFTNNDSKNMTHLPTIRLYQGYYPSQFAMQYAAYVYIREKMGVDVTFYPSNDPNILFERYANYYGWCQTSNSSQCSEYAPYPTFYFEDIATDKYDLLLEIWDVAVRDADGFRYYEQDKVTDGGISGVYGEGGWFVPKYVYDNNPEWTLPKQLKYNETVRQAFIDAYTIHSDTNWVDKWWKIWNTSLSEYDQYGFGFPNYTKPIIFGSNEAYAISAYSGKLVNTLEGDGIDWTFAALGSEGELTNFVIDLYEKELPFIANIYSPHLDFATILPNQTEYMAFERIALPRNPNNDVQDECYVDGLCTFPLSPLLKIGNPRLAQEFPEIYSFLLQFEMATSDVNNIIAYHKESAALYGNELSEHQIWINATCKWLKTANTTIGHWYQDITRYDCIFDENDNENNNCGFNYYYQSFDDAKNEENMVNKPWYDSVAGECTNSTVEPLCSCFNDNLVGDTCRISCPGIIGPILDDNPESHGFYVNESRVKVGEYVFYLCSGNGICDIDHKQCNCELGYGGNDCGVVYQVFKYSTGLIVLWMILFIICIIILSLSIGWVWKNQHYKTIKALSPKLTILFTCGLILLCLGTILYLFHPLNDALCNIRNYFYGVGAILTIMAPLCKTYRVAIIFAQARNLKKIEIPDKKLLMYLVNAVAVETIICIIYSILHQVNGGTEIKYLDEYERVEYVCNQSAGVVYIQSANYLYIFTLIMVLCFFSFKNRATHKVFKESRCAYFGSFFSLFVFLVVAIFNVVVDDISAIITIQCGAMLIALCVIWGLFYGIRMHNFFKYPDERSTVTVTANNPTRTSQSDKYNQTNNPHKDTAGSNYQPSYINELYKARGFESTTQGPALTETSEQPSPLPMESPVESDLKVEKFGSVGRGSTNKVDPPLTENEEEEEDEGDKDESDHLINDRDDKNSHTDNPTEKETPKYQD